MLEPIKVAFGEFMVRFYASIAPTTRPLQAYVTRGAEKSIAWAPTRMVDSVEDMLSLWSRSNVEDGKTRPHDLPVIFVSMSKDYVPTARDYTRQIADKMMVVISNDPKARTFGLRVAAGDIRAQVVVIASDEPTARALAAQFLLFLDATDSRRFMARHSFSGQVMEWPVQLEAQDPPAAAVATESKNLTILAVDLNLRAEIPIFDAPPAGAPNDGRGVAGQADKSDLSGYPVISQINITSQLSGPGGSAQTIGEYVLSTEAEEGDS